MSGSVRTLTSSLTGGLTEKVARDPVELERRIAALKDALASAAPAVGSAAERARRAREEEATRTVLFEACTLRASNLIAAGRHEAALGAAGDALDYATALHGDGALETADALLLFAEASLGAGRLPEAEELLARANWSIVRAKSGKGVSAALLSRLHGGFGRLYAARGEALAAVRALSESAYEAARAYGPESTEAARIYLLLARSFEALEKREASLAFLDKVVECWYKRLQDARGPLGAEAERAVGTSVAESAMGGAPLLDPKIFTEAVVAHGRSTLAEVARVRETALGKDHIATGEALYAGALLAWAANDSKEAAKDANRALDIYARDLPPEDEGLLELQATLAIIQNQALYEK